MDQQPSSCFSSSSGKEKKKKKKKKKKKNKGSSTSGKVVKLSTDPQSIAARERRHRISDRFKILRSLVPGGSKMDTVTMLEEAIHYVKFLKTQIWSHQTMINLVDDYEMLEYYPFLENKLMDQLPSYDDAFQQVRFPFSDGDQFRGGEETNISGDAGAKFNYKT